MEFSRQEYWSRLLFPSPGDLPNPGVECGFPELQAYSLDSEGQEKPGVLQSMGSHRVGHDWATEQQWTQEWTITAITDTNYFKTAFNYKMTKQIIIFIYIFLQYSCLDTATTDKYCFQLVIWLLLELAAMTWRAKISLTNHEVRNTLRTCVWCQENKTKQWNIPS